MTTQIFVQEFDHHPTRAELACFVDPRSSMIRQRVIDTPEELRIVPAPIPMWVLLLSMSVPIVALVSYLFQEVMGELPPEILGIAPVVAGGGITAFYFVNRHTMSQPDCLILNKDARSLELPLFDLKLQSDEIAEIIEVFGSYMHESCYEVTVLRKMSNGHFVRYPLDAIMSDYYIRRTVRTVPKALGVRFHKVPVRSTWSHNDQNKPPYKYYDPTIH